MMNMWGFIQLLIVIILCWFLIFSIVDRICKCVESSFARNSACKSFEKLMDKYANSSEVNNFNRR